MPARKNQTNIRWPQEEVNKWLHGTHIISEYLTRAAEQDEDVLFVLGLLGSLSEQHRRWLPHVGGQPQNLDFDFLLRCWFENPLATKQLVDSLGDAVNDEAWAESRRRASWRKGTKNPKGKKSVRLL
jgi:hypothetical protein